MSKLLLTLILFCSGGYLLANEMPQDSTTSIIEKGTAKYLISEGKRLYNEGQYRVSLVKFREAIKKDKNNAEATYWLGECHLALGNHEKALMYVSNALRIDKDVSPEAYNILGICQHRLERLDSAIVNYKMAQGMVSEMEAKELQIAFHIAQCERAMKMMEDPVKVNISPMASSINTAADETAPVLTPDGKTFYFVSRRADNKGGGISPGDDRYFEDIYVSQWDEENNQWGPASNSSEVIDRVNTYGMDAISHISPDGQTMYLTINTMILKSPKPKTKHSDLFYCKMNRKGKWNSPKPMGKPVNSLFFDAAVSLTADGSEAYFVSERIGGEGRADLWMSYKEGNGWGKPVNLGDSINTKGNETTVFISPDGQTIYFSSTGHEGMGGYDIYYAKRTTDGWGKAMNLGYPINTVADETHFVYYEKLNRAYYSKISTAENKGNGARDLFEVKMDEYVWR